jgi:hypothetical protein
LGLKGLVVVVVVVVVDPHDCSLASSSFSSQLIYLFVGRASECRRLQRELRQADRRLHPIVVIMEPQVTYVFFSQIMSYILNMLICVGMILLDNLLQCLLFIAMIDLSRICDSTASLICNALVMFIIYPWIKIKLKVLIFPTGLPIIRYPYPFVCFVKIVLVEK